MECEDEATLVEVLQKLEGLDLHVQPLGVRAVVFPATELEAVRRALESQQLYPHVVGTPYKTDPSDALAHEEEP